ncbi:MAG: 4Fe-4S binding protein [Desulfurococcus sp.]|jgi:pyruvate ferredoxin oxidoreductase delta subunit|uniref:4Fe-4S binding protein n=1 Tax=Desulfurococcus sp. TaxID=51678 RepID=UPI003162D1BD
MSIHVTPPKTGQLPLTRPGIGVAGKTGFWRTTKPVVDQSKCTRCYQCEIFCPVNVIRVEPETGVKIDYDYCKGCGVCADVCPVNAISIVEEVK